MKKEEEYIRVRKDLIEKYGFGKAAILQYIIDCGGCVVCRLRDIHDAIGVYTIENIYRHMNELIKDRLIISTRLGGYEFEMKVSKKV